MLVKFFYPLLFSIYRSHLYPFKTVVSISLREIFPRNIRKLISIRSLTEDYFLNMNQTNFVKMTKLNKFASLTQTLYQNTTIYPKIVKVWTFLRRFPLLLPPLSKIFTLISTSNNISRSENSFCKVRFLFREIFHFYLE